MKLFTMGFTQKDARTFFELIRKNNINLLVDIRLNNQSQLAGFTKGKDLEYLLKEIADCRYVHDITFAPTKELLDDYKKGKATWGDYVVIFKELIEKRKMCELFEKRYGQEENVLLLCSEPTPEKCHRRLVAEALVNTMRCELVHI